MLIQHPTQFRKTYKGAQGVGKRLRLLGYTISIGMNRNAQRGKFYSIRAWKRVKDTKETR